MKGIYLSIVLNILLITGIIVAIIILTNRDTHNYRVVMNCDGVSFQLNEIKERDVQVFTNMFSQKKCITGAIYD